MMTSLFSVFDPTSSFLSNWIILFLIMLIFPKNKWFLLTKKLVPMNLLLQKISSEFKMLSNSFIPGMMLFFMSIIIFIMLSNLVGLLPYIFTSTSQMSITLTLALVSWFSFNFFGWLNNTSHMMSHLVPLGTPPSLMNFMVCIESTSSIIRPLTLSIRLSANMIAGHLLISLLGNIGPNSSFIISSTVVVSQIILLILELAVAIIQSYVFSILLMLYISEVN